MEPPYTERYVRWCERSAIQLMDSLLLDRSDIFTEIGYCIFAESPPLDGQFLYTVLIVADEV